MKNHTVGRRKEILKIRAETNAKETKETRAKINSLKKKRLKAKGEGGGRR